MALFMLAVFVGALAAPGSYILVWLYIYIYIYIAIFHLFLYMEQTPVVLSILMCSLLHVLCAGFSLCCVLDKDCVMCGLFVFVMCGL